MIDWWLARWGLAHQRASNAALASSPLSTTVTRLVGPPDAHRLGGLAGALEGERVAVELVPLAEVLPQVDSADPGHHTAQVPAGLDRGQLPVVADQDHLGTGGRGVGEQAVVVAGADHARLVDDQHRVGREPAVARIVQLPQQPSDVDAVADAGAGRELLNGLVGEGGTDHPVPGGREGIVDHGQRARLAGAGDADDGVHRVPRAGQVVNHGELLGPPGEPGPELLDGRRPPGDRGLQHLGRDHRPADPDTGDGGVDQAALDRQQFRGRVAGLPHPLLHGVQPDGLLRVSEEPVGMTQHLRHSVFSGRRTGEPGGVALDDVTATEAGVLEGEPPRAGELLGELLGAWPLQPSDSYRINPVVASERLGCSGGIAVRRACEHAGLEPGGPGPGDLAELVEPSRVEAKVSSLGDPATPEPGRRRSAAGQVPIAGREPGLGRPVVQGRDLVGLGSPLRQEGDPGDDLGPALGQRVDQLAGDANELRGALDDPGRLQPEPS
jgi:hypothetical protein